MFDNGDILVSIATIVGPIGGVLLGAWITKTLNDKPLQSFTRTNRDKAVNRIWNGKYKVIEFLESDVSKYDDLEKKISIELMSKGKVVTGIAKYEHCGSTTLILRGGFRSESELYLSYQNQDKRVINFGGFLLKLNGNADKLSGYVTGRGRNPDCPLVGRIDLE